MPEQTLINAETGATITSEYAGLGVVSGFQPPPPEQLRMILLSWSGEGKTTFVSSIPRCLILDFGNNAGSVVAPHAHRVWVKTWPQFEKLRDLLIAQKKAGKCPYDDIAFDTVDEWFDVLASYIISQWNTKYSKNVASIGEVGREGKGFSEVGALMSRELRAFDEAGFGWIATGHLREAKIKIGEGELTVIRPVLAASSFRPLVRMAHIKAQINVDVVNFEDKTVIVGDKKLTSSVKLAQPKRVHRLQIRTATAGDEIKARLPHLPDSVDFPRHDAWKHLSDVYRTAVTAGTTEDASQ